jgi:hypothetical protein
MGRWRESWLLLVVGALAVLAAAPAGLTAFKVTNAWAVSGTSLGVAVLGAGVTAAWQERYKKAAQRRDEQELQIESGCLVLPGGRLPKVGEVSDPIRLGVHPAMPVAAPAPEEGRCGSCWAGAGLCAPRRR